MTSETSPLAFPPSALFSPSVLSYPKQGALHLLNCDPTTGTCTKSWHDVTVTLIFAALFLIVRAYLYRNVYPYLANRWKVPRNPAARLKFSEQSFLLLCHSVSLLCGAILIYGRVYASCLWGSREGFKHFWIGYPMEHKYLSPVFKSYYLGVLGYWVHHVVTLTTEGIQRREFDRRKAAGETGLAYAINRSDFWPLALHHGITIGLTVVSYFMNFTRGGHVVIVLLDVADIFLPLAKIFRYAGHQKICDVTFAAFTLSWIYTRHYVLLLVVVTIWRDSLVYIPVPSRVWDPWGAESFFSMKVYWLFIAFFGTLQLLLVYWLAMIIKVVVKVVRGASAEDVRSDDEDEVEDTGYCAIEGETPTVGALNSIAKQGKKAATKIKKVVKVAEGDLRKRR